jgi:hypothetical protein
VVLTHGAGPLQWSLLKKGRANRKITFALPFFYIFLVHVQIAQFAFGFVLFHIKNK